MYIASPSFQQPVLVCEAFALNTGEQNHSSDNGTPLLLVQIARDLTRAQQEC